jgi:hypothetical protein
MEVVSQAKREKKKKKKNNNNNNHKTKPFQKSSPQNTHFSSG